MWPDEQKLSETSRSREWWREKFKADSALGANYWLVPDDLRYGSSQNRIPAEVSQMDRISGLPVIIDEARKYQVEAVAQAVREGKRVVILEVDADQLKPVNGVSRAAGDEYVAWYCARTAQVLKQAELSAQIAIGRQKDGGDEARVVLLDVSDDDLVTITQRVLPELDRTFAVDLKEGKTAVFGMAVAMVASDDFRLEQFRTRPEDVYQAMVETAEDVAKSIKNVREVVQIPMEKLAQAGGVRELIEAIKKQYGKNRIGADTLEVLMELVALSAAGEDMAEVVEGLERTAGGERAEQAKAVLDYIRDKFRQKFGVEVKIDQAVKAQESREGRTDWRSVLASQLGEGYDEVPPRFRAGARKWRDELTGVPVLTDEERMEQISQLGQALAEGDMVAIMDSDADYLKRVNLIDRKLGDELIRWKIGRITQLLNQAGVAGEVSVWRRESAGDEVRVMARLKMGDREKLLAVRNLMRQPVKLDLPGGEEFTFSMSGEVMFLDDVRLAKLAEVTREQLQRGEIQMPYELYDEAYNLVDERVDREKALKELAAMPLGELRRTTDVGELVVLICREYGRGRVGTGVLDILARVVAIRAAGVDEAVRQAGDLDAYQGSMLREIIEKFWLVG